MKHVSGMPTVATSIVGIVHSGAVGPRRPAHGLR
jgi:hypothetical protein